MSTVYALSTAHGRAGLAVVRISGPAAGSALSRLTGKALPAPRMATLSNIRCPESGEILDRGLVLYFKEPESFTGEDVAELHIHGGPAVLAAVLDCLGEEPGLTLAEPGEFTRRAFDNGRLDLSEVEGLADLIAAETEAQRRQALRQMGGGLSRLVEGWRENLLRASALAEAEIDFADEELPEDLGTTLTGEIDRIHKEISSHLDDRHLGERLRHGFEIAIVGPPNAGKSSLLNALVERDAAIVTDVAGTTRDVIEVHLDLNGYPVSLADTAGLRDLGEDASLPAARIEEEGMARSRRRAATADLVLLVLDRSCEAAVQEDWRFLSGVQTAVVWNKADLEAVGAKAPEGLSEAKSFAVSAKTGEGLGTLIAFLREEVVARLGGGEAAVVTRRRHRLALEDCVGALARVPEAGYPELAAEDLRHALSALGRITGRNDIEDVLDRIFGEFCIGK